MAFFSSTLLFLSKELLEAELELLELAAEETCTLVGVGVTPSGQQR